MSFATNNLGKLEKFTLQKKNILMQGPSPIPNSSRWSSRDFGGYTHLKFFPASLPLKSYGKPQKERRKSQIPSFFRGELEKNFGDVIEKIHLQ